MCFHQPVNGCGRLAAHDAAAKLGVFRWLVTYNMTLRSQSYELLMKKPLAIIHPSAVH